MLIKRTIVFGLVASVLANSAFAAGVRMFKFEETPDPREVARVLSVPPPGLKMRSIRMLPTEAAPEVAKAVDPSGAPTETKAPDGTVYASVTPASATDASPATPMTAAPSAPAKATADDLPSSLALPVQFAFDSARIMPAAHRQLDAVASGIKLAGAGAKMVIEGHTDAIGSAQYNLRLSSERAEAVRTYLITRHGLDPARLRVVGMGKFAPLDKNTPNAPENRRVEFRAEG
jgi:outer membrane protein OmpA-like peptidoglycan-associated protein